MKSKRSTRTITIEYSIASKEERDFAESLVLGLLLGHCEHEIIVNVK